MKINASEIQIGQRLIIRKRYQSYRILQKIKETSKTITFRVIFYMNDIRCVGDFIEKDVTFRKSTTVESREDSVSTKFDQLYRIKPERLNDIINRGLELYRVKRKQYYSWGDDGIEAGEYIFAMFNGINYETECILDDGRVSAYPPSKNSDKPQLSGYSNEYGGFEDYYEKVDMKMFFNIL